MSTQLIAHLKKKCEADDNVKILLSQWEFDQKLVGKALENIGGFYPHFSNHNASHSQQILVNIERLLGEDIGFGIQSSDPTNGLFEMLRPLNINRGNVDAYRNGTMKVNLDDILKLQQQIQDGLKGR